MTFKTAEFPDFDGLSPDRVSRFQDATPSPEDWDQIVAEFLAIQAGFDQAAITSLTDSTGGTTDGTLDAVDDTTLASIKADIDNNFKELFVKLDAILVVLRVAKLIK